MAIITISDVHGMIFWKDVVSQAKESDRIIFLGDYFDLRGDGPYADSQVDNFLEICDLAKKNPNVHLLMGNHDFQYTPYDHIGTTDLDYGHKMEFRKALMDNFRMINAAHFEEVDGKSVIFSHAGVTQDFLDEAGISSVDKINACYHDEPEKFAFIECCKGRIANGYGDNTFQTPFWIRPRSLYLGAVKGYDQVVGHTQVDTIESVDSKNGDTLYFTCTFNANCLVIRD